MKKIITLLSVLILTVTAQAQLINAGFETWSADALAPTAMNPNTGSGTTGWWTYNMYNNSILGSSPVSVYRSDTAHSGTYSARIQTVVYTPTSHAYNAPWGTPFIGHDYLDTLGILFNGNTNETAATYEPGIPFTQKISTLSFWYQYAPQAGDTAECRAALVTNRVLQGGGLVKITGATGSTWHQATITFYYVNTLTPDTLYILFSSSSLDRNPKPGSVLWVDDVSVTLLASGVNEILSEQNSVDIFPNPFSSSATLKTNENLKDATLTVYNSIGAEVKQIKNISGQTIAFQRDDLPVGLYFIRLTQSGKTFSTEKFVITD